MTTSSSHLSVASANAEAYRQRLEKELAKASIGSAELAFTVHSMLVERRNDAGLIVTGGTAPELIVEITRELQKKYRVHSGRVWQAFRALQVWELVDTAYVKKSGMRVSDLRSIEGYMDVEELRRELRAANSKVADMELELASLRQFHQAVAGSLEQHDKNMQSQ